MGRGVLISLISCGNSVGQQLTSAVRDGDVGLVQQMLDANPKLLNTCFFYQRQTLLHVAAAHGQPEVLSMVLERGLHPNTLNRNGQTPLMLACKTGQWTCIEPLLKAGASILGFDSRHGRTCLHYACRGGYTDCVRQILDASRRGPLSQSWGLVRFVNLRDCRGETALHMAARMGHASVLRLLLDTGALVSTTATTAGNAPGPGSSPIHYAARGGSVDCVRELLAWGADRNQRDLVGYTAFGIAMQHSNTACAAILNPQAAEPLVWPSPWKFMSEAELEPEAKTVLQAALAQANIKLDEEIAIRASREEARKSNLRKACPLNPISEQRASPAANVLQEADTAVPSETLSMYEARISAVGDLPSETATKEARISMVGDLPGEDLATAGPDPVDKGSFGVQDVCCICFEQFCTIEVLECGHQMCATCTLSLCCYNKPNPAMPNSPPPACPFCRHSIGRLILARPKPKLPETLDKKSKRNLRRSRSKNSRGGSGGFGSFTGSILGITLGGSKRHGNSGRVSDAMLERIGSRKQGNSGRASDASLESCGSKKHGNSGRKSDASLERSASRKSTGASGRVSDAGIERSGSRKSTGASGRVSDAGIERCGSKRMGGSGGFVDAVVERCGGRKLGASGRVADADWLDQCGSKRLGASSGVAEISFVRLGM